MFAAAQPLAVKLDAEVARYLVSALRRDVLDFGFLLALPGERRDVAAAGDDHCHLAAHQVGGEIRQPVVAIFRPAIFQSTHSDPRHSRRLRSGPVGVRAPNVQIAV